MLIRILIAVSRPALSQRLLALAHECELSLDLLQPATVLEGHLDSEICDLAVVDRGALGDRGAERISAIRTKDRAPEIVYLADKESPEERALLLAAGCRTVLDMRASDTALEDALHTLIEDVRAEQDRSLEARPEDDRGGLGEFFSVSPQMDKVLQIARRVSRSDASVVLLGETGVGKEHLARSICAEGPRRDLPFIVVNCGAIPENLLESQLFGHEKGAFTGAVHAQRGLFELAHGGTIFLDEIGEMPLHLQVKLLRVLQDKEIHPLGSERPIKVDVRVIAATNRDLLAEMQAERFRPDLYYRLSVVTLTIPPLRDRPEDLESLSRRFLEHFRKQIRTSPKRFSAEVMRAFQRYHWPGNVRELMNVIERAVLLCSGEEIGPEDLPESIADVVVPQRAAPLVEEATMRVDELAREWFEMPLREAKRAWVASFERRYLEHLLRETSGRIGITARRAGIEPRSLHTKMKAHGLRKEDYREHR